MILTELYDIYFKKWSYYNVFYKKIPILNKIIFYFIFLIALVFMNIWVFKSNSGLLEISMLFSIIGLFCLCYLHYNYFVKRFLFEIFKIEPKSFFANYKAFKKFKNECFIEFINLKYNFFDDEKSYDLFIEILNDKIDENKPQYVIDTSIKIAFTVPIWIQVLTYFFQHSGNDVREFVFTLLSLSFILFFIYAFYYVFLVNLDAYTNQYYKDLKVLRKFIKDIKLENIAKNNKLLI